MVARESVVDSFATSRQSSFEERSIDDRKKSVRRCKWDSRLATSCLKERHERQMVAIWPTIFFCISGEVTIEVLPLQVVAILEKPE
jgi:hypothetical protein